ncbi:glycosyltransferase [Paraburkholderia lycopersici]|nr:glycosyltransferase [Paraburkholderia lycopersici]
MGAPRVQLDDLSVSVVIYRPDVDVLTRTFECLGAAARAFVAARRGRTVSLSVVDNGDAPGGDGVSSGLAPAFAALRAHGVPYRVIGGHGNVGYGRGHNLALEGVGSACHLVLNPDIDMEPEALVEAVGFLERHPEVGLLTPWVGDADGRTQYLCRRFPAVLDLLVRGFLPASLRSAFASRLARYEMREAINVRDVVWEPPIVSGCFMLFRTTVLKQLGGFDPRYFLYFEDYDLSLRTHALAQVAYVPAVCVVHHGGGASRKGFAHIRMFGVSLVKFYNRFGWKLV